jgi:hypothetical protein
MMLGYGNEVLYKGMEEPIKGVGDMGDRGEKEGLIPPGVLGDLSKADNCPSIASKHLNLASNS